LRVLEVAYAGDGLPDRHGTLTDTHTDRTDVRLGVRIGHERESADGAGMVADLAVLLQDGENVFVEGGLGGERQAGEQCGEDKSRQGSLQTDTLPYGRG
jgi:hypothetical protein